MKVKKLGNEKGKYNAALKSLLWGVLGLVVSYYMINSVLSFMGWILLALSLLMFVLAAWQAWKANRD